MTSGPADGVSGLSPRKAALLARLLEEEKRSGHAEPRNGVEEQLCGLWSARFGRPITPEDDFFQLGGDSILAMQLASLAHSAGLNLRSTDILTFSTIRALAGHVTRPSRIEGVARAGDTAPATFEVPMTPMQQAMLYQCQQSGVATGYISQFSCGFPRGFDPRRFIQAWSAATASFSALRSAVRYGEAGRPILCVERDAVPDIAVFDWIDAPAEAADRAYRTLAAADRSRGFDLQRPPLSRLTLVRKPDGLWHCLWSHHHLLLDGWSQLVVLRAVFRGMRGERTAEREDSALVLDYAAYVPGSLSREGADFWKASLAGASPCSFPRREADGVDPVETASAPLGREVTRRLQGLARGAGAAPAAAFELLWGVALAALLGRDDAVFGLVTAIRPPEHAAEELAWLCINTVPARVTLDEKAGLGRALAAYGPIQRARLARSADPLNEILRGNPQAAFGSVLVIENFHRGVAEAAQDLDAQLAPTDIRFWVREFHPLICVITAAGDDYQLEVKVDRGWSVPGAADEILALVKGACERASDDPDLPLPDLARALARRRNEERRAGQWARLRSRGMG